MEVVEHREAELVEGQSAVVRREEAKAVGATEVEEETDWSGNRTSLGQRAQHAPTWRSGQQARER